MARALLVVFMLIYNLATTSGAIDKGVIVFGTTVSPNFHRAEGIRE